MRKMVVEWLLYWSWMSQWAWLDRNMNLRFNKKNCIRISFPEEFYIYGDLVTRPGATNTKKEAFRYLGNSVYVREI